MGGDRLSLASRHSCNVERLAKALRPADLPHVGEMSGRTEGGATGTHPFPNLLSTKRMASTCQTPLAISPHMYIHNRTPIGTEKIMAAEQSSQPRARVWRNARLATLAAEPARPGHRRARRHRRTRRQNHLCRCRIGPPRSRDGRRGDHRLRRPLDHAGPDRLPHPSRPCRQPRQRVRDAAGRRDLRGSGEGRRRHRLVGQGIACGERGRARAPVAAAARRADRRRRHDDRDQVGLRPRPRQ